MNAILTCVTYSNLIHFGKLLATFFNTFIWSRLNSAVTSLPPPLLGFVTRLRGEEQKVFLLHFYRSSYDQRTIQRWIYQPNQAKPDMPTTKEEGEEKRFEESQKWNVRQMVTVTKKADSRGRPKKMFFFFFLQRIKPKVNNVGKQNSLYANNNIAIFSKLVFYSKLLQQKLFKEKDHKMQWYF